MIGLVVAREVERGKTKGRRSLRKALALSQKRLASARSIYLGLTCGILLSTAGCVSSGRDFPSKVDWINKGVTSQAEAQQLLGEPYSVGNSSGRPTWTYGYYKYRLFGKSFIKELKLFWAPGGTVETYSFNSSFPADTGQTGGIRGVQRAQ